MSAGRFEAEYIPQKSGIYLKFYPPNADTGTVWRLDVANAFNLAQQLLAAYENWMEVSND